MAVSLGFGILFATLVTLILIPINYLVMDDLKSLCVGKDYGNQPVEPRATETPS